MDMDLIMPCAWLSHPPQQKLKNNDENLNLKEAASDGL
jgi:hypothetical protein